MARGPKNARYEVTEVWGNMVGKVAVGDVLVDTYRGNERTWQFELHGDVNVGGMVGRFIGRRTQIDGPVEP